MNLRASLFGKYVVYFVVLVSVALIASGAVGLYFTYQENKAALLNLQREKASAAASRIETYIQEIERQLGWVRLPTADPTSLDERNIEFLKLLRLVPAITDVVLLDARGREALRVSRLGMDVADTSADLSADPKFNEARSGKTYFSPVYFRKETEPYMTIAIAGVGAKSGVTVAEVNLKFIWDVISRIKIGEKGVAYVVDSRGQLIAHPDISYVLQKRDLSDLPQVRAARTPGTEDDERVTIARNAQGQEVLTAHAAIAPLGWLVFAEQPLAEAFAAIYASLLRTGLLLVGGLVLSILASLYFARRMVRPIRAIEAGAVQLAAGKLDQRIDVDTADELGALASQFNNMAAQLKESYSGLERKVEVRTEQLADANRAKSRFLAAASHDLRQPVHALGLFVAQLQEARDPVARDRIIEKVEASTAAVSQLVEALLDISKLDQGTVQPQLSDFALQPVLDRLEHAFSLAAQAKDLRFRLRPSALWIRSDPVLLERIVPMSQPLNAGHIEGLRVLLIDDDSAAREAAEGLLTQWGCEVVCASSGKQAYGLLSNTAPPAVIISDYRLGPRELGTDVVREIRARLGAEIPAVIVSADSSATSFDTIAAEGLHLLRKPLKAAQLRVLLHHVIATAAPTVAL